MTELFRDSPLPIRDDLRAAHERVWQRLARPGSAWTGETRVAIAAEARVAGTCSLCRERREAVSPAPVAGEHTRASELPEAIVDAVHRVSTDASRITQAFVDSLASAGVDARRYAELVGIVACLRSMDAVCFGVGARPHPLPTPEAGEPTGDAPARSESIGAFIPVVEGRLPAVLRALGLCPDAVRDMQELGEAHYLGHDEIVRLGRSGRRALTRPQIELVASRVSALNECFY